jgi:hypothetical protein
MAVDVHEHNSPPHEVVTPVQVKSSSRTRMALVVVVCAIALAGYGVWSTSIPLFGQGGTPVQSGTDPDAEQLVGCQSDPVNLSPVYAPGFTGQDGYIVPLLGFDITGLQAPCLAQENGYSLHLGVQIDDTFRDLSFPLNLATAVPVPESNPVAYRFDPAGVSAADSVNITGYTLRLSGGVSPSAPTIDDVAAGNASATVTFSGATPGSTAITGYQYSIDGGSTWTDSGSSTSPITIAGLTNNVTYQVAVRAVNATGPGATSNVVEVTPIATEEDTPADIVIAGDNTGL